jgi:hypothetical protein
MNSRFKLQESHNAIDLGHLDLGLGSRTLVRCGIELELSQGLPSRAAFKSLGGKRTTRRTVVR